MDRLAELRESQGLTLRDLAERSGVDANTINQVELGHRKPRPSTLRKLAKALSVEVSDFFREPAVPLAKAPREAGRRTSEEERRAAWDAAVEEGRRLRETGRSQVWKALSEWSASKRREEPYAARRKYLDEIGDLLREVYDADGVLGWAYIEAALSQGGSEASVPRYLQKESRATGHFYGKLLELVEEAGLSIRTGEDAVAAKEDAGGARVAEGQEDARPLSVQEAS